MATLSELERSLHGAGEPYHLLHLQDAASALVTQRGARVLGLFPAPDADNLLWTNKACTDASSWRSFTAAGGWNLGGERCWIAPEIQYNVRDRSDFFATLAVPTAVDPGQYDLSVSGDSVRLEQTISLTAYNLAVGEKHLHVIRTIRPAANPLALSAMDDLAYAGYEQTASLVELNDTPILSAIWNLVQLKAGGRLIIPCFGAVQSDVYFGSAPDEARASTDGSVRIDITGERQFKVGYRRCQHDWTHGLLAVPAGWARIPAGALSSSTIRRTCIWKNPRPIRDQRTLGVRL